MSLGKRRRTASERLREVSQQIKEQMKDCALLPLDIPRVGSFAEDDPDVHLSFKNIKQPKRKGVHQ